MTGYGEARAEHVGGEILAELWSLNHRHFDFSFSGPEPLGAWEVLLKRAVATRVPRGRVRLAVRFSGSSGFEERLALSESRVQEYLQFYRTLKTRHNLRGELKAEALLMAPHVVVPVVDVADREALLASIHRAVDLALDRMETMQFAEGHALATDLLNRFEHLGRLSGQIRELAPQQVLVCRKNLESRLKEWHQDVQVPQERLALEIALLADRADITEELVRMDSHLLQSRKALSTGGEIGHRLDFLAQELNREINTVGAKSQSSGISEIVVDFKEELSRIREQVQNIL